MLSALVRYNVTLTPPVAIALPISCACAFARLSRIRWIALAMRVYVNTLRSMPLVMVMFWIYMDRSDDQVGAARPIGRP